MGKTIIEKIISRNSKQDVRPGMTVICDVDRMMTNDASGPLSLAIMKEHGYTKAAHPEKVAIFMDHYVPCPNEKVAKLQESLVTFAKENPGLSFTRTGVGIGHHLMDEQGLVQPGALIVGGDSHSTTYGFLNAAGIGMGSTDLAVAIITGKLWFCVPETIKINLHGKLQKWVSGKDLALRLIERIGPNGGDYRAFEFGGEGMASLTINDRKTVCNLMAECGAKCGIMPFDSVAQEYCEKHGIDTSGAIYADPDCVYSKTLDVDLNEIGCTVAVPHSVHTVQDVHSLRGTHIDMALLGTCTGGKIGDFIEAMAVCQKSDKPFKAEVIVVPASSKVLLEMIETGIAATLIQKGASLLPAGCGPCCGSSPGVPRDGFNVISTANRNFLGRMGNTSSFIYLASPAVVCASALAGEIVSPEMEVI